MAASGAPEGRSAARVQRQQVGPGPEPKQGPGPSALRWDLGGERAVAMRARADKADSAAVAAASARDGERLQPTHLAASHTARESRGSLESER